MANPSPSRSCLSVCQLQRDASGYRLMYLPVQAFHLMLDGAE